MTEPVGMSPSAEPPAEGESNRTVIIAFAANLLIAVAKTVAAVMTGAASMLAEAAHSWADAGNEVFPADRAAAGGPRAGFQPSVRLWQG